MRPENACLIFADLLADALDDGVELLAGRDEGVLEPLNFRRRRRLVKVVRRPPRQHLVHEIRAGHRHARRDRDPFLAHALTLAIPILEAIDPIDA